MKEICNPKECTGCAACANSCGHGAISIESDKYGYLHPVIDKNLCVDCGLCVRICPNNSLPIFNEPKYCYVGCAKDAYEQLTSTSGGIASVLCRWIIQHGGVVFGCTGNDIYNVKHIKITSTSEINLLKGSKYVQSQIDNTMFEVKKELIKGKTVLFIGTPCQIAGLKSIIPIKLQYKLLTVDFVCHGVPSQKILNDALNEVNSAKKHRNIQFRIKEYKISKYSNKKIIVSSNNIAYCPFDAKYNTRYGIFSVDKNRKIYSPFPKNDYIVGFLRGLFYRESCYQCRYAKIGRVSDITLGDFRYPKNSKDVIAGENRLLSKVLINTDYGAHLIKKVTNHICVKNIYLKDLINEGGQLTHPMPMHPQRTQFLHEYTTLGFRAATKIIQSEKKIIRNHILLTDIRDVLYRLPFVESIVKRIKE